MTELTIGGKSYTVRTSTLDFWKLFDGIASVYNSKKITENIWLHKCNRCQHDWVSKMEIPNTCADKKCRSPYWNKPRKRGLI